MAKRKSKAKIDPVLKELKDVKYFLQVLVVLEAAQSGMTKNQARKTAKLGSKTVTGIWKNIKIETVGKRKPLKTARKR